MEHCYEALSRCDEDHCNEWGVFTALLEVAKHYEDGARKYAGRRGEKGMTDEEAIKALSCEVAGRADCEFQLAGMDCSQCIDAVWESARSALRERIEHSSSEAPNNWISVKDESPEEKTDVLVFGKKWRTEGGKEMEDAFPSIYVAYTRGDRECYFGAEGGNLIVVTHWRPLPQPPKEDANGA